MALVVGSVGLLGLQVSPEFELALYTLLVLAGAEENVVQLGPYKLCFKVQLIPTPDNKHRTIHVGIVDGCR